MSRSAALLLCLLGCNVWKAVTKTLGAPEAAQGRLQPDLGRSIVLAFCQLRILNCSFFSIGWYGRTQGSEQALLLFFTLIPALLLQLLFEELCIQMYGSVQ
ncbi:hypothetical protein Q9233_003183 [Columba guinea]|nr:hypothetical protein Q9233_003183 [Columba guinea]